MTDVVNDIDIFSTVFSRLFAHIFLIYGIKMMLGASNLKLKA